MTRSGAKVAPVSWKHPLNFSMADELVHVHAYYVHDTDKQWNADYNKQIFRTEIYISPCLLKPRYPRLHVHVPVHLNP